MDGQITMFEYLHEKPPIGSTIYFFTAGKAKKATVISLDASFAGLPYAGYIKVRDSDGSTWSIINFVYHIS